MATIHVVRGTESKKLLAGHDKAMTEAQAKARATDANERAESMGLKTRYEAAEIAPHEI